ncbi:MAG: hypothetical protein AAGE96_05905 [Cyanobacteria bacterium P01_G01_bin.19]
MTITLTLLQSTDFVELEIADPGNTFDAALYLGELGSLNIVASETIGGTDSLDIFQFSLSEAKQIGAALSTVENSSNADLALFSSQGEVLAISQETEIPVDSFGLTLDAGDYYLAVGSGDINPANYSVAIAFDDVVAAVDSGIDSTGFNFG